MCTCTLLANPGILPYWMNAYAYVLYGYYIYRWILPHYGSMYIWMYRMIVLLHSLSYNTGRISFWSYMWQSVFTFSAIFWCIVYSLVFVIIMLLTFNHHCIMCRCLCWPLYCYYVQWQLGYRWWKICWHIYLSHALFSPENNLTTVTVTTFPDNNHISDISCWFALIFLMTLSYACVCMLCVKVCSFHFDTFYFYCVTLVFWWMAMVTVSCVGCSLWGHSWCYQAFWSIMFI